MCVIFFCWERELFIWAGLLLIARVLRDICPLDITDDHHRMSCLEREIVHYVINISATITAVSLLIFILLDPMLKETNTAV